MNSYNDILHNTVQKGFRAGEKSWNYMYLKSIAPPFGNIYFLIAFGG